MKFGSLDGGADVKYIVLALSRYLKILVTHHAILLGKLDRSYKSVLQCPWLLCAIQIA